MIPELHYDAFEQILIRVDVKDLIRCKSVCKSWHSFISGLGFVKAHLNHTNQKKKTTQIGIVNIYCQSDHNGYSHFDIVGSSNGLICTSPSNAKLGIGFVVVNPSTREVNELPNCQFDITGKTICWGFGYDSTIDDYKVIVGFNSGIDVSCFHVCTLKSNIWKTIGPVKCTLIGIKKYGILCNGAVHWFMYNPKTHKNVIMSFDLSREVFKEIPQPDDAGYNCIIHPMLGVSEKCLCIFPLLTLSGRWLLKKDNVKQYWKFLPDSRVETFAYNHIPVKCSFGHLIIVVYPIRRNIGVPMFVQTLVSPHVNRTEPSSQ